MGWEVVSSVPWNPMNAQLDWAPIVMFLKQFLRCCGHISLLGRGVVMMGCTLFAVMFRWLCQSELHIKDRYRIQRLSLSALLVVVLMLGLISVRWFIKYKCLNIIDIKYCLSNCSYTLTSLWPGDQICILLKCCPHMAQPQQVIASTGRKNDSQRGRDRGRERMRGRAFGGVVRERQALVGVPTFK